MASHVEFRLERRLNTRERRLGTAERRLKEKTAVSTQEGETLPLHKAVELSHGVKQKVEGVAELLEANNDQVRNQIADGNEFLLAENALAENERVESTVKEVADELGAVNSAVATGVEDLKVLGEALTQSKLANEQIEAQLLVSVQETGEARHRALYDLVTELPNRALFEDRLVHAIAAAQRHRGGLTVVFLDLDRFKQVNDSHGHAAGDVVLKEVARRLALQCRGEDTVCRYGGDEFLFLLVNPQGAANVQRIVDAISETIAAPIDIGDTTVTVGSSIGVASFPDDGRTGPALVEFADAAMYAIKQRGRS